jgi:hypothetical protein
LVEASWKRRIHRRDRRLGKTRPHEWVTLRALRVLKSAGRLG